MREQLRGRLLAVQVYRDILAGEPNRSLGRKADLPEFLLECVVQGKIRIYQHRVIGWQTASAENHATFASGEHSMLRGGAGSRGWWVLFVVRTNWLRTRGRGRRHLSSPLGGHGEVHFGNPLCDALEAAHHIMVKAIELLVERAEFLPVGRRRTGRTGAGRARAWKGSWEWGSVDFFDGGENA
jgi:hypothetical protein